MIWCKVNGTQPGVRMMIARFWVTSAGREVETLCKRKTNQANTFLHTEEVFQEDSVGPDVLYISYPHTLMIVELPRKVPACHRKKLWV